jgi:hypothetical protein
LETTNFSGSTLDRVALALGYALGIKLPNALDYYTFGLYLDTTSDQFTAQYNAFICDLLIAKVPIIKTLIQETYIFIEEEVYRITNQISNDLVSIYTIKHINALLKEYKAVNAASPDSSIGTKAEQLSTDPNIPPSLCSFLVIFTTY